MPRPKKDLASVACRSTVTSETGSDAAAVPSALEMLWKAIINHRRSELSVRGQTKRFIAGSLASPDGTVKFHNPGLEINHGHQQIRLAALDQRAGVLAQPS